MIVIGLTGGIGTGKSVVSGILEELGASVLDADKIGHETYRKGTEGHRAVVERFGAGVVDDDGGIRRSRLAEIVFSDPEALASLNAIVHPLMRRTLEGVLCDLRKSGAGISVVEAAILLEAGWDDLVDEVWVVDASDEAVGERLRTRFGGNDEAILARVRSQMARSDRLAASDEVILNDGSLDELRGQVERLYAKRTEAAHGRASGT